MPFLLRILGRVRASQARLLATLAVASVLAGAVAFSLAEHVSLGIGLYWAITTATTVGYGDVTPHNTAGRIIAVAVMLTAIPLAGGVFAVVAAQITASRLGRLLTVTIAESDTGFVALVGSHRALGRIAEELVRAGERVRIVASQPIAGLGIRAEQIQADPTDEGSLRRVHLERASRIIVAGSDDAESLLVAVLVRELAPTVPVLVAAASAKVREALGGLGVQASIAVDELLAHTLAKGAETPHAGNLLLELVASERVRLVELPVTDALVGMTLDDAGDRLGGLVIGRVRGDRVELAVGIGSESLAAGDRVVVVSERQPSAPSEPGA
ncbi:Ion transport 2 domain protein [Acidimicrobium ferrooxidans DSM 10331]|uniref:Ion transport 2 domain protein n=1 Tax=Acidimicrobium ferrooxidans (strain DSM 10331 / JCM 15462 / NBRC 103882 / ICP) TaxID=525909 RepID=C7LXV1_ACIFD|nr:potassium channel protein [Acidimicrobium ferrooxidans]ACU53559.1 Ion transport 2 domain protein [Acidimicrobium ferrooxidans DSM 10331]